MYGNLMVLISFLILFFQNFGFLTPFRRRLATPILTAVHISTSSNSAENLYFYLFYGADFIFDVILSKFWTLDPLGASAGHTHFEGLKGS